MAFVRLSIAFIFLILTVLHEPAAFLTAPIVIINSINIILGNSIASFVRLFSELLAICNLQFLATRQSFLIMAPILSCSKESSSHNSPTIHSYGHPIHPILPKCPLAFCCVVTWFFNSFSFSTSSRFVDTSLIPNLR